MIGIVLVPVIYYMIISEYYTCTAYMKINWAIGDTPMPAQFTSWWIASGNIGYLV